MNRFFALLVGLVSVLLTEQIANAGIYALKEIHSPATKIEDILTNAYKPCFKVDIDDVEIGDLLRVAAKIEVSAEDDGALRRSKIKSFISVRPESSENRTRVSSYAWQIGHKNNNHHMPLNLFGRHQVTDTKPISVEIMASKTTDTPVDVLSRPYSNIVIEQYRFYCSVQAARNDGARLLAGTKRAPFSKRGEPVGNKNEVILEGVSMFLVPGDFLRIQSAATASYLNDEALFGNPLFIKNSIRDAKVSTSTENTSFPTYRITHQNDGCYKHELDDGEKIRAYHKAKSLNNFYFLNKKTDLVAMHFANITGDKYLSTSLKHTSPLNLEFNPNEDPQIFFIATGQHEAGDVLRVQSQLQLDVIDGENKTRCWARIAIYENGSRKYISMYDQRFLTNSSDKKNDHDCGTYSPFALHTMTQSGTYEVHLIGDCDLGGPELTIRATHYGRHLTVDHFSKD